MEDMKPIVRRCCANWSDDGDYCRMSEEVPGWGCRLLVCMPDRIPTNKLDRKRLFEKVYTYAQECGVLDCPHFRESIIDEVIDDPDRIAEIVRVGQQPRTDLLSGKIFTICN